MEGEGVEKDDNALTILPGVPQLPGCGRVMLSGSKPL